ncbi:MAG: hypothetical protein WC511_02940 [Candidatus Pacearchaeota archaeon]
MIKKYSILKRRALQEIPQIVRDAFVALGEAQRDKPEQAMLNIQNAAGGGVLSVVVEHAGDLIHRMTHMLKWTMRDNAYRTGYEYVADKVGKVLRYLTNEYGFEREMQENIRNNAVYAKKDPTAFAESVYALLAEYAKEHKFLKVYNRAQWLAREACVAIGNKDFKTARFILRQIEEKLKTPEEWDNFASEYQLNPDGSPMEYPWKK